MNITMKLLSFMITTCVDRLVEHQITNDTNIIRNSMRSFNFASNLLVDSILKVQNNFKGITRSDMYIIEYLNSDELVEYLKILKKHKLFNNKSRIILLSLSLPKMTLKILSQLYVFRAILLNIESGKFYEITPFQNSTFIKPKLVYDNIGFCDKHGFPIISKKPFSYRSPRRWRKSSIKIVYERRPLYAQCHNCEKKGLEIEIADIVFDHLDIRKQYHLTRELRKMMAKYYSEGFFSIGGFVLGSRVHNYDYTAPFYQDTYVLGVRVPEYIPRWQYVFKILNVHIWMLWFISVLLFSLAHALFSRRPFRKFLELFIQQCFLLLGQIEPSTSKTYLSMLFLSLMMNTFFSARLQYILNGLDFEKSIDTVEELVSSKKKIFCTSTYMLSICKWFIASRKADPEVCVRPNVSLRHMIQDEDAAVMTGKWFINIVSNYFRHKASGLSILKVLNPPIFSFYGTFVINVGHPVFPAVNEVLVRVVESGISNRIVQKYDLPYPDFNPRMLATTSLKFEHILSCLVILVVGILLSSVLLIAEIFIKRYFN